MAKIFRRRPRHAGTILKRVEKLESRLVDLHNPDDPKWLRRRINDMRRFADKREVARDLKVAERQKNKRA